MSLCVSAGAATLVLAWSAFTLSWTHSVERIAWQEDWRVGADGLEITESRVQGTGAGMEPAANARFENGWWIYRPSLAPLPRLVLARSDVTDDWRLCFRDDCVDLRRLGPATGGPIALYSCSE